VAAWWDEEHKLLLLSQEEFDALPDGEVVTCIDDTTAIKGTDEIDDDVRAGHLAYGVVGNHPLRVAKLEQMLSAPPKVAAVIPAHRAWTCKIGIMGNVDLPPGADWPMRKAVEQAFFDLTGKQSDFNFSGWGAKLEDGEYDVVTDRAA
jgi:hypothetical protein